MLVLVAMGLDAPLALVAIRVYVPEAPAATVTFRVADVPSALIVAELTLMAAGVNAGLKENVEPVRFTPVTWSEARFTGEELLTTESVEMTVKLVVEAAVLGPTVTEIGPVVAVGGTIAERDVDDAEMTTAATPLKFTALEPVVVLKFCP